MKTDAVFKRAFNDAVDAIASLRKQRLSLNAKLDGADGHTARRTEALQKHPTPLQETTRGTLPPARAGIQVLTQT